MNIGKDSVSLGSDLMANTITVMKLLVKVLSVYYMIWVRYFLALFGKNMITRDYKEIIIL